MPKGRRPRSPAGQFPCPIQGTQTKAAPLLPPPGGVTKPRSRPEKPAREGRTHREEDHLSQMVEGLGPPVVTDPFSHRRDPDGAATPPISAGSRSLRALPTAPPRATREPTSCGHRPCRAANSTLHPLAAATKGPRQGERSEMGGPMTRCSLLEQTRPMCTHQRSEHGTRIAGPGPIAACVDTAGQNKKQKKKTGHQRLPC